MFQVREYKVAASLEEAWELNQKKANRIGAGMLWQRMQSKPVGVLIDLSGLGLNQIEETEDSFRIGCMATLRQIECHEGLNRYTDNAAREAVRHIIGVQFRNLATVGGSLFGRFGFSDVLTLFLVLDTQVELYKGGIVPLREFVSMPRDNDILVRAIVRKEQGHFAYQSVRTNASTDFPVLTMAGAHLCDGTLRMAVGARPGRAQLYELCGPKAGTDTEADAETDAGTDAGTNTGTGTGTNTGTGSEVDLSDEQIAELAEQLKTQVPMGDSHRGSAAYRTHLAGVLTGRVLRTIRDLERQDRA